MAEWTDKVDNSSATVGSPALKKAKGGKKANLKDVMDDMDFADGGAHVADQLHKALKLKVMIGVQPEEKKNIKGSGLLKELYDLKDELGQIATEHGLEGLRHVDVVFTVRLQEGRTTLDPNKLMQELLANGVKADVVQKCIINATKQGDPFWVREIGSL